ncbi:hypothetical protein CHS0354_036216 [Potamilus streckersoni]|uniref:Uncharacterized protein n=1 Tax=Potamilus streckersoni TaxID=2493646 RepID=A0AAE0SW96_9BIVA|nr:hypothetical protein CHS0354_036216 [Potamilus streckersoni]
MFPKTPEKDKDLDDYLKKSTTGKVVQRHRKKFVPPFLAGSLAKNNLLCRVSCQFVAYTVTRFMDVHSVLHNAFHMVLQK